MKIKKILSLVLTLAMILGVLTIIPFSAAAETKYTFGDWEYEIWKITDSNTNENLDVICITAYNGDGDISTNGDGDKDVKVTIPNVIDDKPVAYLYGIKCFANANTLTELTIPSNLRFVNGGAFRDCTKLSMINISPNNSCFEFENGVLYMKDGNRTLGDHTHSHVNDIPDEYGPVFAKFSLGTVDFPPQTTTVYEYAFYNHKNLANVSMTPAIGKLKRIESFAFAESGIYGEQDIFGNTSLIIPYGVYEIGLDAFMNCKNLHSVSLPETLKKIGRYAFYGSGIVNFKIPDSLEEVGDQAFGESYRSINIFGGKEEIRQKIKDTYHYKEFDESTGPGGGSGGSVGKAIMIHHDPDDPFDHIYTTVAAVPPTCTTPGLNIYKCICGYIYYGADTIIQACGHNWTEKRVYSTCFEQGYTLHTCKNCGETYKDNYKKVLNHYRVAIPAVEPTETKAGSTAGIYCDDCGTILEQPRLIPPTGCTEKEDNGVKVISEPEKTPKVKEVNDEKTIESIEIGDDKKIEKVYDIKIEEDGKTVDPEGDVIVKIPCKDADAEVYHQEADGALTNMNAYNDEEGNKVFKTDSFSLFIILGNLPKKYQLWVNNEQFSDDHLTIQCGDGTASFDPSENILTLENAQITKGYEKDQLGTGILSFLDKELIIVVNGNCSITETGGDGIGSYETDEEYNLIPHDITLKGDGKLTITESKEMYGYGFYCTGRLKLEGVDINIDSAASGIWTNMALNVQNSKLNINCSTQFSGIVINSGSAIFDSSDVYAESTNGAGILLGNDQDSSAMLVSSGKVIIKGKTGIDTDTDRSAVSVSGGKLIIEGQNSAFSEKLLTNVDQHILLGKDVDITSGSLDGTEVIISNINAAILTGDSDGDGEITISDATKIQQWLAKLIGDNDLDLEAAKTTDGPVSIIDATRIQQHLVKLINLYA